jgi:hypothetical protein
MVVFTSASFCWCSVEFYTPSRRTLCLSVAWVWTLDSGDQSVPRFTPKSAHIECVLRYWAQCGSAPQDNGYARTRETIIMPQIQSWTQKKKSFVIPDLFPVWSWRCVCSAIRNIIICLLQAWAVKNACRIPVFRLLQHDDRMTQTTRLMPWTTCLPVTLRSAILPLWA